MDNMLQTAKFYILPSLLVIFSIIFLTITINSGHTTEKEIKKGTLTLTEDDLASHDNLQLNGEWAFYDRNFLKSNIDRNFEIGQNETEYITVPGTWKNQHVNNQTLSSKGYGTYKLHLQVPHTEKALGLQLGTITSSYRLWVNDELLLEKGEIGTSRSYTRPFISPDVVQLDPDVTAYDIVFEVANFSQRKVGLLSPVALGDYEAMQLMLRKSLVLAAIIIGMILIMGLHHILLFLRMRNRYDSLWFGLICLTLALKMSVEGQYVLSLFVPNLSNNVFVTIEYFGFMASPFLFTMFVYHFFPDLISKPLRNVLIFPATLFIPFIILAPVHIITKLALMMQGYAIIAALVIMFYVFKAAILKVEGARLLSIGFAIFFVTILSDMMMNNDISKHADASFSFGLLFIIVCTEVILSFRLYSAYKTIEKMSLRMLELDKVKDEFLANISYELRTPLNSIVSLAQSLSDHLQEKIAPEQQTQLHTISSNGKKLSYLINDMLDYSRLSNNDMQLNVSKINLYQIIELVITVSEPTIAHKQLIIENKVDQHFPPVQADTNKLQQILFHLIGNAIKYTENGKVTISASTHKDKVKIYIQDTGIGMEERELKNIFQPFNVHHQQMDPENTSTRFGLHITKMLVEMHQGNIQVTSEKDIGTTFSFTFPYQESNVFYKNQDGTTKRTANHQKMKAHILQETKKIAATTQETSKLLTESIQTNETEAYKLLIIDNEAINLKISTQLLNPKRYDIDTITFGEEAVNQLDSLNKYDIIITDLMLPDMSGFELCHAIRDVYTIDELPILVMTSGYREDTIITAFQAGANDYISKPFGRNELISRIKNLVLLKRAVSNVKQNAKEVNALNLKLVNLNKGLEDRIKERTVELEQMNEVLESRNQALNRLESSRRQLLSDISHELRTPITAIQGYVEVIATGLVDTVDEQQQYLEMVLNKSHALNRLIQDLFELSRLESGRTDIVLEIIPLARLMEQTKDKFAIDIEQAGLHYKFNIIFDVNMLEKFQVIIDLDRIYQVFTNLIFNAIKFTKKGGTISMICDIDLQNKSADIAGHLFFYIKDTGSGMKEESIPYIFDRFYREKNNENDLGNSGSGIGLAITKEIIEYHDGTIKVAESVIGKGTTFYFTLPLYQLGD